jgi:hypothetical protein
MLNRRKLIATTALFLAVAALLAWWYHHYSSHRSRLAVHQPNNAVATGVNLLCFGDWGYDGRGSWLHAVARQIESYAHTYAIKFDAALLTGDNIYSALPDGVNDRAWQDLFQDVFPHPTFPIPFYPAAGNHDYPTKKLASQLEYQTEDPTGRWQFPAKWYRVDVPTNKPLVSLLVLDSNLPRLTPAERASQFSWLEGQLDKIDPDAWVIVMAHHPIFSNGHGGDTAELIPAWGELLRKHRVDFYISGHDHGLQHIELPDWPISFVVSAGGGAKLESMSRADRGPFSRSLAGFLHLNATTNIVVGSFITAEGQIAHEFYRTRAGAVTVIRTTGCQQPAGS